MSRYDLTSLNDGARMIVQDLCDKVGGSRQIAEHYGLDSANFDAWLTLGTPLNDVNQSRVLALGELSQADQRDAAYARTRGYDVLSPAELISLQLQRSTNGE